MADTPTTPAEDAVPASLFVLGDPNKAVLLAGLLADKPELRDQTLPRAKWQKELDAYAKSTRV